MNIVADSSVDDLSSFLQVFAVNLIGTATGPCLNQYICATNFSSSRFRNLLELEAAIQLSAFLSK